MPKYTKQKGSKPANLVKGARKKGKLDKKKKKRIKSSEY